MYDQKYLIAEFIKNTFLAKKVIEYRIIHKIGKKALEISGEKAIMLQPDYNEYSDESLAKIRK